VHAEMKFKARRGFFDNDNVRARLTLTRGQRSIN